MPPPVPRVRLRFAASIDALNDPEAASTVVTCDLGDVVDMVVPVMVTADDGRRLATVNVPVAVRLVEVQVPNDKPIDKPRRHRWRRRN